VTGPLTDAQLAARLPLSVTGPLTSAQLAALEPLSVTGPLTSAQLLALEPLSVDVTDRVARVVGAVSGSGVFHVDDNGGTLTVDGPLTDAQLRAAVVPVGDGGGTLT